MIACEKPDGACVVTSVARKSFSANIGLATKKPRREPGEIVCGAVQGEPPWSM